MGTNLAPVKPPTYVKVANFPGMYRHSRSGLYYARKKLKKFLAWWPHGWDFQVRQVRPSMLNEWLAREAPRLRNVSYIGYTGFLKQLFDIAVKDRIMAESPYQEPVGALEETADS